MLKIIVPIYNTGKFLNKTLESIQKQSYENFMCIMVNDGSFDNSQQICEEFVKKDKRFVLINKIRQDLKCRNFVFAVSEDRQKCFEQANLTNGSMAAVITGLSKCEESDILGFMDSDDEINQDYYKNLMIGIEKYDADFSVCEIDYCNLQYEDYMFLPIKKKEGFYSNINGELLNDDLFKTIYGARVNKVIKAKLVFDVLKYLDSSLCVGDDELIIYSSLSKANTMFITNESKYRYVQNPNSLSHKKMSHHVGDLKKVLIAIKNCYVSSGICETNKLPSCYKDLVIYYLFIEFSEIVNQYQVNDHNDFKKCVEVLMSYEDFDLIKQKKVDGFKRRIIFWLYKNKKKKTLMFVFRILSCLKKQEKQ